MTYPTCGTITLYSDGDRLPIGELFWYMSRPPEPDNHPQARTACMWCLISEWWFQGGFAGKHTGRANRATASLDRVDRLTIVIGSRYIGGLLEDIVNTPKARANSGRQLVAVFGFPDTFWKLETNPLTGYYGNTRRSFDSTRGGFAPM